jgi:hypothetical protein
MSKRLLLTWLATVAAAQAQYAGGTIFQSLDALQPSGVTGIGLPGNGSLTTGEVLVYSQGWTGGSRSLFSAEALGAVLGDRNGDAKPFDWVNVDALHVGWTNAGVQPKPFDFRFSFEYDLVNASGSVVISSGDIFKLTGNGGYQVTIPRSAFVSALAYTNPSGVLLNVDGFALAADGSALISLKNQPGGTTVGSGTFLNPFGASQTQTIYGSDIFVIRQPYGTLPAIKLYAAADFQPLANLLFGTGNYTVAEIRDFDVQPNSTDANNPYDIPNVWNSGNRPQLVFTFYGDENVACTQASTSPTLTNVWALVQGASGVGQYSTNLGTAVYMDALAVSTNTLPAGSAITIDTSPHNQITVPGLGTTAFVPQNAPGTNLTFTVRNLNGGAGKVAAFVVGVTPAVGAGYFTGLGGYNWLFLDVADPVFQLSLQPPYSTLFTTGASDAFGTASTATFVVPPGLTAYTFYLQAVQLGPTFTLSAPQGLRIQ